MRFNRVVLILSVIFTVIILSSTVMVSPAVAQDLDQQDLSEVPDQYFDEIEERTDGLYTKEDIDDVQELQEILEQNNLDDLQNQIQSELENNGATNNSTTDGTNSNTTINNTTVNNFDFDHQFQFTEIQARIVDKSVEAFIIQLHNPTNDSETLIANGVDGPGTRGSVVLDGGEYQTLNLTPFSPYGLLYAESTISEPIPYDAVQGQERDLSDTTYRIVYQIIQPVTQPPVPHSAFIVFLGGVQVLMLMLAGYMFNARPSRVAKPINHNEIGISDYMDGPNYSFEADDPMMVKLVKFTIDWIKSWGMIIVNISIACWGLYRFVGGSVSGRYVYDTYFFGEFDIVIPQLVEDSMVYMMYGEIMFWFVLFIGMYLAKQSWVELSDMSPPKGDNLLYNLTPTRWRDTEFRAEVQKPDPDSTRADKTIEYEVPRTWAYEINKHTKGDSYEVYNYDVHDNVAYVSWSGELQKLNPSKLRESKNTIDYVMKTSMYAIDRYYKFLDFYSHDVLMEARYLFARRIAIREDADMEGLSETSDRVEQRMESRGEADALSGDELAVAKDIDDDDMDYELLEQKKEQKRSDTTVIDESDVEAGSSGDEE